ncbi:MAG: hypothetical protein ACYCT0_01165 [Sulfobacillus sp.]
MFLLVLELGLGLVIGGSIAWGLAGSRGIQYWIGLTVYATGLLVLASKIGLLAMIPMALGLLLFFHLRMPS